MYQIKDSGDNEKKYGYMVHAIKDLLETETDVIANLSNISAFINSYMDRLNWVGFYLLKQEELVLGPFQGSPACIRIKMGKGVCGTAAAEKKIIMVENVHEFPGHIACDSQTNSEIVLPIYANNAIYGVLDLDSPDLGRFSETEKLYLSKVADMVSDFLTVTNSN